MHSEAIEAPAKVELKPGRPSLGLARYWPFLIGLLPLAAVTIQSLSKVVWTREDGAHGPIILATAGWLIWRVTPSLSALAQPKPSWPAWLVFVPSLLMYGLGHAIDFISVETAGLYGIVLSMALSMFGLPAIRANWFPFVYPAFLIPPPEFLLDRFTAPLKQFVSAVTTTVLSAVGIPVSHEGVTLHVAQYDLLVKDACSGMNSLTGLIAVSLLYIYLLRGSSARYSLVLTAFVIPIAILGNILRVMVLVLLTYFFGDAVAQGFAHETAGLFLFAVDLLLVFAVDALLARSRMLVGRPQ